MKFGIGKRELTVSIDKVAAHSPVEDALMGATDREMELMIHQSHTHQEPRWQISPALYRFHI